MSGNLDPVAVDRLVGAPDDFHPTFGEFADSVIASLYFGTLPAFQSRPLGALIAEGRQRNRSRDEIAYALATAHHETARFRTMEEWGQGEGRPYGEPIWLTSRQRVTYHGRGFVQLTWLRNYALMSRRLGIDLVTQPDRAMEPAIAAQILWEGMIDGVFTGRGFADCRDPDGALNFREARRIVNGTDQAATIAGYAVKFLRALQPKD